MSLWSLSGWRPLAVAGALIGPWPWRTSKISSVWPIQVSLAVISVPVCPCWLRNYSILHSSLFDIPILHSDLFVSLSVPTRKDHTPESRSHHSKFPSLRSAILHFYFGCLIACVLSQVSTFVLLLSLISVISLILVVLLFLFLLIF